MEFFPKFVAEKSNLDHITINDSIVMFEDNPENYERLSKLTYLDLSYNDIEKLSDKFKKIVNLKYAHLLILLVH
jgi:Leucine-rich repeat (LRR) protein